MESFKAGDRVVAINTDMSGALCPPADSLGIPFLFPDEPLRKGRIYHVEAVTASRVFWITGLQALWGKDPIPWDGRRFRKVDLKRDHAPKKRRKKSA